MNLKKKVNKKNQSTKPPKSIFSNTSLFLLFGICIFILSIEFLFDLTKEFFWYKLALILDFSLIFAYIILAIIKCFRFTKQKSLFHLTSAQKADVAFFIMVCSCLFIPRLAAGFVIARVFVNLFMRFLESDKGKSTVSAVNLRPSQTLALSFVGIISLGTLLLSLPASTHDGKGLGLVNSLFTMTSATCVSGLTLFNLGEHFTRFGQAIILLGVQIGGLGIMVLSAAFAVLIGGSIPSKSQAGLREVLDISTPEGLVKLIRAVTASTIIIEFIGAVFLFVSWMENFSSFGERAWWALFHSISAFCNAGLSLFPKSLEIFVNEPAIIFIFSFLITFGGLGFFVFSDLVDSKFWSFSSPKASWQKLQIQTKVVLLSTAVLNTAGLLIFLFLEYDGALHGLPTLSKINASIFYAVNLRSAGFNVVPLDVIFAPTIIFSIFYMFIGASPGSTGGGIKTTTAAISVMAIKAMLRGRQDVEILGRRIPSSIVSRSLSILLIAALTVVLFLSLLLATQNIKFEYLFFESVSAFGTVGLSLGNTTKMLDTTGKLIIVSLMYIGRIGPLTLALAVGEKKYSQGYHLPKGNISVG